MPPRKKGRVAAQKASTPAQDEDSMIADISETEIMIKKPEYDPLKDPWTDEQETSLFKGIIRWKPAGVHKHFRMIALSEHLRNHGYDPKIETHTRIPGIWEKLGTLYNLDVIDERENSFDYADGDIIEKKYLEFSLSEDDFGDMMWMKGMAPSNANSSPSQLDKAVELPEPSKKRKRADTATTNRARASTIEDTDEAKSSPAPASVAKPGRPPKSSKRSSNRLKVESSDRHASKDTTADDMDEKAEGLAEAPDADDDENEEAGAEVETEAEAEAEADDGSPSPRTSRSAAKAAKGGTQNRTQSTTRKSTRRK